MELSSAIAIYLLFWWISLFVVLPFGIRTDEEVGVERVRGHAESAPHRFSFGKAALRATIASSVLFALYYANWINGWVTPDMLDWTGRSSAQ